MTMRIEAIIAQAVAAKAKDKKPEGNPNAFGSDFDAETAHQMCLHEAGKTLKRIEAGNARLSSRKSELEGFDYAGREVVVDDATGEIKFWIYLFKNKEDKVKSAIVSKKDGRFVLREGHGAAAKIIKKARGTLSKAQVEKVVCKAPELRTPLHEIDPEKPFGSEDLDEESFDGLLKIHP